MRFTEQAHHAMQAVLSEGSFAVDATCGQGFDTLFLAQQVGPKGKVWAFDIQDKAIELSQARLEQKGLSSRVCFNKHSHAEMDLLLPKEALGKIAVVCFNLGYLPTADKTIITKKESTVAALKASLSVLEPGGLISLMVYRGHLGAMEESDAIDAFLEQVKDKITLKKIHSSEIKDDAPLLILIRRV